jgi:hypothetical protein
LFRTTYGSNAVVALATPAHRSRNIMSFVNVFLLLLKNQILCLFSYHTFTQLARVPVAMYLTIINHCDSFSVLCFAQVEIDCVKARFVLSLCIAQGSWAVSSTMVPFHRSEVNTMKRMSWIFAVFTAMLMMTGTAYSQCYYNCGGSGGTGTVTETSSASGWDFSVITSMYGNAYASGGEATAGSYGFVNYSADPVMVNGEEVSPLSLSAGYQSMTVGSNEPVDAGGALDAYANVSQSTWDWSYTDEPNNTSAYSQGGDFTAAGGYAYGEEASIGGVGQFNVQPELGANVDVGFGGIFGFGQEGTGYLEGEGWANGGITFQVDYSDWGWTSGN